MTFLKVLIVEDDAVLCGIICTHLNETGYNSECCSDGNDASEMIDLYDYDLIVLDRMLPGKDGVSIVSDMRKSGNNTPVLMITALNGINDRVNGLDAGADDYLTKPFALQELSARVRALLRRPVTYSSSAVLPCGGASFYPDEQLLKNGKAEVKLSGRENALLEYLIRHDGQTMKRSQIISSVWGSDTEIEDGNLDNFVYFLRRRLKAAGSTAYIKTVYGTGYKPEINSDEKEK